ncbi:hypothetical protein CVT25_001170 [Psilocybe cyanescens]|uniref:Uncharacterized protein n=1 Tax=Psilocybe cyanescens TaxID=93625 RepID=A0A409XM94_PSICY|nr:hypothetical protein CVT25_001170 [Psilocybe cyanescens]
MMGPPELATAEAAVRRGGYGGPMLGYPTAGPPSTARRTLCMPSPAPRAVDMGVCTCVFLPGPLPSHLSSSEAAVTRSASQTVMTRPSRGEKGGSG